MTTWSFGDLAKLNGKMVRLIRNPDRDGDAKVVYQDGSESWASVDTLTAPSEQECQAWHEAFAKKAAAEKAVADKAAAEKAAADKAAADKAYEDCRPRDIEVATISGNIESFSLPLGFATTVGALKAIIQSNGKDRTPIFEQNLLAGEMVMRNSSPLLEYDISCGVTLLVQPDKETVEGRELLARTDKVAAEKALKVAMQAHADQCETCSGIRSVCEGDFLAWDDRRQCCCVYDHYHTDIMCQACETWQRCGKSHEIQASRCKDGARVQLHGLLAKPQLNNRQGVCVKRQEATDRWTVKMLDDGLEFSIKEGNLLVMQHKFSLVVGSASMQGHRPTQEDRHVKIPDLTKAARALKMPIDHLNQPCAFLAVYDGHCGHACAEFAAKNFHMRLLKKLSAPNQSAAPPSDDCIEGILRSTSEELDTEFLSRFRTASDGSTLVVALIIGERCFLAWAGDSRGMLGKEMAREFDWSPVSVTRDHRPTSEAEAGRIRAVGGEVVDIGDGQLRVAQAGYNERVCEIIRAEQQGLGNIGKAPVAMAVSRSLGDRDFKAAKLGMDVISPTPEVQVVFLDKSYKLLVLVSDGITDVMTNEDIVSYFAGSRGSTDDAQLACGALVQEAIRRGSYDNVTAGAIYFEWIEDAPPFIGPSIVDRAGLSEGETSAKRLRVAGGT